MSQRRPPPSLQGIESPPLSTKRFKSLYCNRLGRSRNPDAGKGQGRLATGPRVFREASGEAILPRTEASRARRLLLVEVPGPGVALERLQEPGGERTAARGLGVSANRAQAAHPRNHRRHGLVAQAEPKRELGEGAGLTPKEPLEGARVLDDLLFAVPPEVACPEITLFEGRLRRDRPREPTLVERHPGSITEIGRA